MVLKFKTSLKTANTSQIKAYDLVIGFMQKVDGKDIAWLLSCKECSKNFKIKDVKKTITGDFKMCEKHLEMIEKKYNKSWSIN